MLITEASPLLSGASTVALVIPAWNEADSIGAVLTEVPRATARDIFVVCGGPDDATTAVAAAHGAQPLLQVTPGYGAACWLGARAAMAAGAEIVAFMDGDYSDPPTALHTILAPLLAGRADLVLGWRNMAIHPRALPVHARLGNRLVLELVRLTLGRRVRDLPSFKAIRLDCLARLQMSEMTYGWTTELVVKAIRAQLCIEEVPIQYRPRLAGKSKVSGTVRGTLGAAWKLGACAVRYSRWTPPSRGLARVGPSP
jgi:glycosyltransferase involved in cell wall biosynthesis